MSDCPRIKLSDMAKARLELNAAEAAYAAAETRLIEAQRAYNTQSSEWWEENVRRREVRP